MKYAIRETIKQALQSLAIVDANTKSKIIQQKLLALKTIQKASNIGIYYSINKEVGTHETITHLINMNKSVFLPDITEQNELVFRKITSLNNLKIGRFGIPAPHASDPIINPQEIDLLIIPATSCDLIGNRIGKGGGYYDKFLAHHKTPYTIALVYDFQILTHILPDAHDKKVDCIISEQRIIKTRKKKRLGKLLYGKDLAQHIVAQLKRTITLNNMTPHLAVLLIGSDPASELYVQKKAETCNNMGIACSVFRFSTNTHEQKIINTIEALNRDTKVSGILIQLPIPPHLNRNTIINTVDPYKDVDGLTEHNRILLAQGDETLACCTPKGIIKLIEHYKIALQNKHICLVGNGYLVNQPLSIMLKNRKISFDICDSKTVDLAIKTKTADVIITATGKPHLIQKHHIKKNVIIIDGGTAKLNDKIVGDVDFRSVIKKISFITPVPGGIGPMTIAMLAENVVNAYKMQQEFGASFVELLKPSSQFGFKTIRNNPAR